MNGLGEIPLAFQPGEKWQYGMSADVLGAIVEISSGMRFGEFLNERIFKPLGMKDTAFYVPSDKQPRLAKVYRETKNGLEEFHISHLGVQNKMELPGYTYANLMRIMQDPANNLTLLIMQQKTDSGTTVYTRKIRNVLFSSL